MSSDLNTAASALIKQLHAPRGAINALEGADQTGAYIRLLIDPMYWLSLSDLPKTFDGYRVVAERREPSTAYTNRSSRH
jgi:hypothetical protein